MFRCEKNSLPFSQVLYFINKEMEREGTRCQTIAVKRTMLEGES